ncbi:MAG: endo alpha-1,4 polygalactosaminidase [Candidatus Thiodiazotropha sp. 6PLUC5]
MNNKVVRSFSVVFFFLCFVWHTEVLAETELTLHPIKLTSKRGNHSEQELSVLSVQEQTGADDNWNTYKEFYTGSGGYTGIFSFELPSDKDPSAINTLSFAANYKGPTRSEQRWRWQIRDFVSAKWISLTDNSGVPNWEWSLIRAEVSGAPDRYINRNNRLKLRYFTRNEGDDSDLDYLALSISLQSADEPPPPPPPLPGDIWQPAPGTSWQLQLQGDIDTSYNLQMYDIDLFDTPQSLIDQLHAQGKTVICYFSAGSWEEWRPDADHYPSTVKGNSNGWPGEAWLDVRRLNELGPILQARLDLAVSKNCDGVDPDNVDGYTNNTGFPLTYQDQLDFNIWLAQEAHNRGLSVGLKNDLDQIEDLVTHFDWALNEQCFQYNECDLLLPFIQMNKAVFGVEYKGDPTQFCPQANSMGLDWLYKNLDLDAWRLDCKEY